MTNQLKPKDALGELPDKITCGHFYYSSEEERLELMALMEDLTGPLTFEYLPKEPSRLQKDKK